MLGGGLAVLQAALFECLSFDPFSLQQDGLTAPEVDVGSIAPNSPMHAPQTRRSYVSRTQRGGGNEHVPLSQSDRRQLGQDCL